MDVRDELITGSYMIGSNGRKEPPNWQEYAIKLENKLKQSMSFSDLSAFLVWAYKNSWYIAKNEGEELFWQNYFSDESISISHLIGIFIKEKNK